MSQIRLDENALAPATPAAGKVILYPKSDGLWYSKDDAGTETVLSAGPGGSNTQVQFNDGGVLGGDAGLTYVKGTDTLTAGNVAVTTNATVGGTLGVTGTLTASGVLAVTAGTTTLRGVAYTWPAADGASGRMLQTNGSGTLSWAAVTAVAGSDTQVQFNDGGALGGDAGLVYNKTTDALTTGSLVVTLGQIVFPASQNASANANTLDDYEEGTFTPTVTGSGGQSGQTYSAQAGTYTKVGKRVSFELRVILSAVGTITGSVQVSGLPFASGAGQTYNPCRVIWLTATAYVDVVGRLEPGGAFLTMFGATAATTDMQGTALVQANVGSGFFISGSCEVA